MNASERGIDLIKSFEGCVLKAYPDPGTGGDPWTIGWGTTRGVKRGMTITQEEADLLLAEDVNGFASQVSRMVRVPLNQNQFDALVSFVYNVGAGAFGNSTLLRLLNEGEYEGAAGQFGRWVHGGNGETLPGLVRRRAAEKALFEEKPFLGVAG
jgi:lysozyme